MSQKIPFKSAHVMWTQLSIFEWNWKGGLPAFVSSTLQVVFARVWVESARTLRRGAVSHTWTQDSGVFDVQEGTGTNVWNCELVYCIFSWYFRQNDAQNLVLSVAFKMSKNGLRRKMMGGACPGQKLPFQYELFEKLSRTMDLSGREDRFLFLLMCLSCNFSCALAKSWLLQLEIYTLIEKESYWLISLRRPRRTSLPPGSQATCPSLLSS